MIRLALLVLVACKARTTPPPAPPPSEEAPPSWAILLEEWDGPYGGVPPLDRVRLDDLEPAIEAAMAQTLAEVDAIASDPAPPTVQNVLVPWEKAGGALSRVMAIYGAWTSTMSSPELREIQARIAPALAEHRTKIWQDERLYRRFEGLAATELTPVQRRLVDRVLHRFRTHGIGLDPEARQRLAAIDQELAKLYDTFGNNLLADEEGWKTRLGPDDLDGLPDAWLDGARDPEQPDTWWVHNTRSSVDPFLTFSTRRDLREKVWRNFYGRGDHGDEHDNNALVTEILALRLQKARILGYPTYAHLQLADKMAKTPERALELVMKVWSPAVAKFRAEVAAMQALADEEGAGITIAPWDVKHYAEKVRSRQHDLDASELNAYLQLEKLREAMFWSAGTLYGFRFVPVDDVPVQHPDIRVWKVEDADGALRGLWYFDPYAREGKRSGAWMNAYRVQNGLTGEVPLVTNQSNFVKPTGERPTTISWDDALTLFHEFGHAIHGLSSDVPYPSLAGTNTVRDFVEFPSQLNEAWLWTPEVLQRFALHVETGEPMPLDLVERVKRAAHATSGFDTTEYLASAIADLRLHLEEGPIEPRAFEEALLRELDCPDEIGLRHRIPQFAHVFAGEGYAAGYYAYLWAEVLTADAVEAFEEAGGLYDEEVADRLMRHLLSVGNTVDPAEAYRRFRGRDPSTAALLRQRGLQPD